MNSYAESNLCPHCGHKGIRIKQSPWQTVCPRCGAEGPTANSEKEARASWLTRFIGPSPDRHLRAALRKLILAAPFWSRKRMQPEVRDVVEAYNAILVTNQVGAPPEVFTQHAGPKFEKGDQVILPNGTVDTVEVVSTHHYYQVEGGGCDFVEHEIRPFDEGYTLNECWKAGYHITRDEQLDWLVLDEKMSVCMDDYEIRSKNSWLTTFGETGYFFTKTLQMHRPRKGPK